MTTFYIALAVVFWYLVVVGIRNAMVYQYLSDLLDRVYAAGNRDIEAGRPWEWRYKILRAAPQERMALEFWRSFKSYGLERAAEEQR